MAAFLASFPVCVVPGKIRVVFEDGGVGALHGIVAETADTILGWTAVSQCGKRFRGLSKCYVNLYLWLVLLWVLQYHQFLILVLSFPWTAHTDAKILKLSFSHGRDSPESRYGECRDFKIYQAEVSDI